jgi:hypothetical protein
MTIITPGSSATITATTIEKFFTAVIWKLQALENDTTRNPSAINNVTSSMSDDSQSLVANLTFSATVATGTGGIATFSCIDYLTSPSGQPAHWAAGSGGTIASTTIQGAIFEAVRFIDNLELQSAKNPLGNKCVSYTISSNSSGGTNAIATVSISITGFPLTTTIAGDGTQSVIGKEYLL